LVLGNAQLKDFSAEGIVPETLSRLVRLGAGAASRSCARRQVHRDRFINLLSVNLAS
jgi:hypothetical protein